MKAKIECFVLMETLRIMTVITIMSGCTRVVEFENADGTVAETRLEAAVPNYKYYYFLI